MKYGLYGAVLAGVVGGTAAWHSVDKTVALMVDGQSISVHTTASHVGDVLQAAGYHVGPHDILAPSKDASIHDGSRIVFQRGRLLHLDVNGVSSYVWTTAPTVAAALNQLGYSTTDFTSVSRADRLPLTPTDLTLRTPRYVTVLHDGKTELVTTTDATVGALLSDIGVQVGATDIVSVPTGAPLAAGETIVVGRVTRTLLTADQVLRYSTQKQSSASLPAGQTMVVTPGKDGLAKITYDVVTLDGKIIGKTPVKTVVVQAPESQVVSVGTKSSSTPAAASTPVTAAAVNVTPGSAQAIAKDLAAKRGWGNDQFSCLVTLWDHESGWRVDASNPSGAYGIPQALPGSKMGSAGPNWQTNATTQITWGLDYIAGRYGTPCGAWSSWQANGGWY